ncbi:MAG: hypothetical protein MUP44_03035, partial [Anaerolineales bacterium]|nr:hypothetical protein [Anaerolineales bacterium]
VLMASSCNAPVPIPTPTLTPDTGTCTLSQLVAPQAFSPSNELVPSLQPSIQWFYPEDCEPDAYRLEIAEDGDFNSPSVLVESVGGGQVPWTLIQALQPATLYQWRVAAEIGNSTGPFSPSPAFWTGPICDASALNPPLLIGPAYGATVQDDSPELSWEYSNTSCIPEGYHFEVAADIQFSNMKISGDGPGPWTSFETSVPFLDDCGLYYWWAAAQTAGVLSGHNLSLFYSDFTGSCSQFSCDSTQLAPPNLLYPIGGVTVTDLGDPFRYRWEYLDPACIPDGYYIEVYSGTDFASTPVGQGMALDSRDPGWGPLPELPAYVILPDCMTIHWHVAALQGSETGPYSSEATFTTDYSGSCSPPSAQEVSFIGMACLENERMMVTFEFPEAPGGTYQAMVDGQVFECQTLPSAPQRLFCSGLMAEEDILASVQLEDLISGALLFDGEISILCEQELESCSTLNEAACGSRSDCTWVKNDLPSGGTCEVK